MSALLAIVKPRRIKVSHRRRRRVASGQSVQRYYDPAIGTMLSVDPVTAYEKPITNFCRYCYPLNATWDEIANSCAIADDIFMRPIRAYFVVTDNGRLGKYANNDVAKPYDLVFMEAGLFEH